MQHVSWHSHSCTSCTLQHPLSSNFAHFFPFIRFGALQTQKSLHARLIPPQPSACLHPYAVQLHPLTCLCECTQNVHCDAYWQLTLFHLWMPATIFQLFVTRQHDHPTLHSALHGIPLHFYYRKLILSCTNAVPLYRLPFGNEIGNAKILACEMCVHSSTYTPFW
jgi:hypothetical protein